MICAVIFDLDGVISDTQSLYSEVESEVLARYGVNIAPHEITRRYSGVSYSKMLPELFGRFTVSTDLNAVIRELHEAVDSRVARGKVLPIDGSQELIDSLRALGLKLAVASASRRSFIEHVLSSLGLKDKFQTVVSAYEVAQGKPEPDIFYLVADCLDITPEECVVIEDGINGMIGAKKAGMKCIDLVIEKDSKIYPADLLVTSIREITPEKVFAL